MSLLPRQSIQFASPRPGAYPGLGPPLASRDAVFVGSALCKWLRCLRGADLSEKWCLLSDKRWEPYKLWSDEVLLVTSRDGEMGALNPVTGDLRWSRRTPEEVAARWRDTVLIKDGALRLLDAMTGAVRESFQLGWPQDVFSLCGDHVLSPGALGHPVSAFRLVERSVAWRADLAAGVVERYGDQAAGAVGVAPSSLPDRFIFSLGSAAEGCLYGGSLGDGRNLWRAPVPAGYGMMLHEGRILELLRNRFVAVDEVTGELAVDVTHPELEGCLYPQLGAISGDLVTFSTQSGHLAVLDRRDGRLRGVYRHKTSLCGVSVVDGRLLVTTGDGQLLVFALDDVW